MTTFKITTTQLIIGSIILAVILFLIFRGIYLKGVKDALKKELEQVNNALQNTSAQRNPAEHQRLLAKRVALMKLLNKKSDSSTREKPTRGCYCNGVYIGSYPKDVPCPC